MDRNLKVRVKEIVQNNERRRQSRHYPREEQPLLSLKYERQRIWGGLSTRTKSLGVINDIGTKLKMNNASIEADETLSEQKYG